MGQTRHQLRGTGGQQGIMLRIDVKERQQKVREQKPGMIGRQIMQREADVDRRGGATLYQKAAAIRDRARRHGQSVTVGKRLYNLVQGYLREKQGYIDVGSVAG